MAYPAWRVVRVPRFSYSIFIGPSERDDTPWMWTLENPGARSVWTVGNGPPTLKDAAGDIYMELPKSGPQAGMPPTTFVYDGLKFDKPTGARLNFVRVVLTADGELPWTDVSRERVLNILIAEAEKVLKSSEEQAAETSYQRWLREAPKRQKDREDMLRAVALADKTKVAQVREALERADRLAGEEYKKSEASEREHAARNLAFNTSRSMALKEQLAAMSPAERAMPAWVRQIDSGPLAGLYSFAAPRTPGFEHLIADKPNHYRFTGSRVQLRALMVVFAVKERRGEEYLDQVVFDSYKAFDWMGAQRLLTPVAKR